MSEVLSRFLAKGLINVGGDDQKYEKLKITAADLTAMLNKTVSKTVPFALIAFDPQAPLDDPVIVEVAKALSARWETYVNTFSEPPIAVFRALLLEALVETARTNERVAVGFSSAARNVLPLMELGAEREIWVDVVLQIEHAVDMRAEAEWATPSSINLPAFKPPASTTIKIKASSSSVARDALKTKIESASGPKAGTPGNNPHWPSSNPQAWAPEFASRMAELMADAIEGAASKISLGPIDLTENFQQLTTSVSSYLQGAVNAITGATAGLQRRTNLLWWKEALFSPSLSLTYRSLPVSVAAASMAFDLYQQLPAFSPASVSAFLQEAVLTLPAAREAGQQPIGDLLQQILADGRLLPLKQLAAELFAPPTGRGPALSIFAHSNLQNNVNPEWFRNVVGIPSSTRLALPEWAAWLFRELQAARATSDSNEPKRRGRKEGSE